MYPFLCFLAAHSSNTNRKAVSSNEDAKSECGWLVGRVRRNMPNATRDPIGAIIRFMLGIHPILAGNLFFFA